MKKMTVLASTAVMFLCITASSALADEPTLQDIWFNVNGTQTELTAPGVDLSSYSLSTGLGTIMFTDTASGAGYFNTWWDEEVSVPFYNEFGDTSGTPSDPDES